MKKANRKNKKIKLDGFTLFVIISGAVSLGMLIEKIAILGFGCLTTIY
jgi:hypothetical protein